MARTLAGGTNVALVHPSVERVVTALRAGGVNVEIREFDESTRTAVDAANALGVPVGAIVKSLVFAADGAPVLVLASGDHQVDTTKVAHVLSASHVGRADADLVRDATGFAIGGVAPIGHPHPLRTVIDTHLSSFEAIWAAAGTPRTVFPTTYDELARITAAVPANIGAPS
jgi:Cys-tRNA(Pro) deacylase